MKELYPIINNGLVGVIDYQKLIFMQSQQPIGTISKQNVMFSNQNMSSK